MSRVMKYRVRGVADFARERYIDVIWNKESVVKEDVSIAKNYLYENEISEMNEIVAEDKMKKQNDLIYIWHLMNVWRN